MAHVAAYKKEVVKKVVELISKNPIVGIVDMENLPAQQLQKMREKLRGKVNIFMTKKRLMRVAFEQAEKDSPGISKLQDHFKGMPALIFTSDNPFALFRTIKQNKSAAPARAGQEAPKDIEVKAGPTPFAPGPIIGELGQFGIKSGVEGGKIAVKADVVVCKQGQKISAKLASILTRMGIEPMEVGLDLVAIYEEGTIFTKDVLDVDEDAMKEKFMRAALEAFNLSVEVSFITKDNIQTLVTKAARESHALSMEAAIVSKDTVEPLLSRAERQAIAISALAQ